MARIPKAKHRRISAEVGQPAKAALIDVAKRHRSTVSEVIELCLENMHRNSVIESAFLAERAARANAAVEAAAS